MEPKTLELIVLHAPVLEVALRGVALYLLLFALFRVVLPRQAVKFGIVEMTALVVVADASQNALAGETISLAECAILAVAMLVTHFFVRFAFLLGYRLLRRSRARRAVA
jgi:uncharacterized membrane protein YcaP (DUF421 family)